MSKTILIDMNGDGVIDETQTDITTVSANGETFRVISNYYANGTLKDQTTIENDTARYNSWIGNFFDTNGDGTIDKEVDVEVEQDGYKFQDTYYYNSDGSTKSAVEQQTSMDGSTVLIGNPDATLFPVQIYYMPNANGSYNWSNYTNSVSQSVTHTIDLNGVDNWIWLDQPASSSSSVFHTVVIDLATEQKDIAIAQRLYDTAFDRNAQTDEVQLLAEYITNGVVNTTTLANKIMASTEYTQKYGTLTNLEFVERMYENALGHAPSLADLTNWVGQLNANTTTRAAVMNAISESEEHILTGNVHQVSNNTDTGSTTYTLDHTADAQVAGDTVRRLYDAGLGRSATAAEVAAQSQKILSGSETEAQVAADILALPEFASKYGTLTNTAFVAQIFQNALGRAPTTAESSFWTSALTAGTVSRADFLDGIAESSDHLAIMGAGYSIGGTGNDYIYAPDRADNIDGGAGVNTLDYSLLSMSGVSIDLNAGTAVKANGTTDHLTNIQNIVGSSGADTLAGNSGNNMLTGGAGADAFVFTSTFGADTVTDFQAAGTAHDLLQFDAAAFSSASAVLAAAQQVGTDVVINSGANSVTLKGLNLSSLTAADIRVQ